MKNKILALTLILTLHLSGQTIADFYIPKDKNKATFSGGKDNLPFDIVKYKKTQDTYRLTKTSLMNGSPVSEEVKEIVIADNEVRLKSISIINKIIGTKSKDFNPFIVVLKFPSKTSKTQWSYQDENNDEHKCTSEFTTLKYNNATVSAIKLTNSIQAKSGNVTTVEYYVKDVGLFKINTLKGEEFLKLSDLSLEIKTGGFYIPINEDNIKPEGHEPTLKNENVKDVKFVIYKSLHNTYGKKEAVLDERKWSVILNEKDFTIKSAMIDKTWYIISSTYNRELQCLELKMENKNLGDEATALISFSKVTNQYFIQVNNTLKTLWFQTSYADIDKITNY